MIKSVPLGHSSMNCNLARVRNNIHIASEVQLKSPKHLEIRRLWVCHSCFPIISLPRCCSPIICLVEMLPLMFDLKVTKIKSPKHPSPRGKVGCCSAAVPNLPIERAWFFLQMPKVSVNSTPMETWKQILANSHKQIQHALSAAFSIDGHFHCFIGAQNRVSLTNAPCSKLFWPLPPTEVAWKSTRSLRLQSKREV